MAFANLGDTLTALHTGTFDTLCTVEAQATGDVNSPTWAATETRFPLRLEDASQQERQPEQWGYAHPLTHKAYCEDSAHLMVGYRLVETHRKGASGYVALATGVPETFLVLGFFRVPGMPADSKLRKLHLWQMSKTVGRA
jgi:hypothetical protein